MPQIFLTGWTCINSDASTSVCTTSVANTATSSEFIAYHDWLFVNVCVFTGTIAGLMGEGGVAVYKAFPPSITPNVPVHAPPITHVEPEFGPPIDSGFIPLGGIFNGYLCPRLCWPKQTVVSAAKVRLILVPIRIC